MDGATSLGTVAVSGNIATFSTSALTAGAHSITAKYLGDASYGVSTSSVLTQTINPLPSVSLVASPGVICIGSSSTLTATNSGGANTQTLSGASGNINVAVPESRNSWAGSNIPISGSGGATLGALDIISITLNITHNDNDQLDIFLVDPSGNRALRLSTDNGGNGNGYSNAVLATGAIPNITTAASGIISGTWGTEDGTNIVASQTGGNGGNYPNASVPQTALLGAAIDGNWQIRVFDDQNGSSGTLVNWSLSITRNLGNYTSVFSGPATIGSVSYSGANNTTATAIVTPPLGINNYTVTTTDAAGCSVISSTVAVTVNPIATVSATPAPQTICSGTAITTINITNPNSVAGTTFSWTRDNTGSLTGIAANGNGSSIAGSLTNSASTVQTTTFTITASAAGCTSTTTVTVNVNPTPVVTNTATKTICSGTATNISLTSSVASSFTWTIGTITGSITGASAGSGSTLNQTLTNTSNTLSGTVQYIITPTATTGSCAGAPFTITVTVNPAPIVTTSSTKTICSGTSTNIALTGSVASTYTWTIGTITGSITGASAGSGSTINQTLTNPGNLSSGTVDYIVTPTATTGSCVGAPLQLQSQ